MTKNTNPLDIKRPNLRAVPQNKTTAFMLPALDFSSVKTSYKLLQYYGFVNCYLDHIGGIGDYKNCLFLVFNPNSEALRKFSEFYEIYRSYSNYVEDYILDAHLIVVVFRVKDKWKETLNEFKNSRYSKMSKDYAEMFRRPLPSGSVYSSDEYHIIHKSKEFKEYLEDRLSNPHSKVIIDDDKELMSPLDIEKETFTYGPIT